jgi:hypothetical protein
MVNRETCLSQILRVLFMSLIFIVISSGFAFPQTVLLNQSPDRFSAYYDDPDQPQTVAENFILNSTSTIIQIRIWGCYVSHNITGADNFSVIFHANSGSNLPGAVISAQHSVPTSRQQTGGPDITGTLTEYVYTLTLATPVTLAPGTYWIEIYNDTSSSDIFAWEDGNVDLVHGIAGHAVDNANVPGTNWVSQEHDTAIEITARDPSTAVPTMTEWGMMIFVILAGLGAVYFMRRQKTVKS